MSGQMAPKMAAPAAGIGTLYRMPQNLPHGTPRFEDPRTARSMSPQKNARLTEDRLTGAALATRFVFRPAPRIGDSDDDTKPVRDPSPYAASMPKTYRQSPYLHTFTSMPREDIQQLPEAIKFPLSESSKEQVSEVATTSPSTSDHSDVDRGSSDHSDVERASRDDAKTSPSASDHSDIDSLAPNSIASPTISDAEKAESSPPSSGSSSPAMDNKKIPRSGDNDASDDDAPVAPVSSRLVRKAPKMEAFATLVQDQVSSSSQKTFDCESDTKSAKPSSPILGRARACQVRCRDMNGCLDGELRSLEDEMADLTRDLVQLKATMSRMRPGTLSQSRSCSALPVPGTGTM